MIYYLPFRSVYYWVCYYTFRKKKREHHKSRTRLVLWQFFPFVCFLLLFGCFFFPNLIPATAKSGCSGTISCFQKLKRLIILMIFLVFSSCRGGRRNFPMTVGFWDIKKKRIKFSQKKNEAFFFFYFGFLLDPVIDNESNRVKPVGLNEETRPL